MFENRRDAGRRLAAALRETAAQNPRAILYGLARGGVIVAAEAGRLLGLPVDAIVVRKVGAPNHEELAMGAVTAGGDEVRNEALIRALGVSEKIFAEARGRARREAVRREERYREKTSPLAPAGRTAILVDDGLATGASMRAAIQAMRRLGARRIVVAAPVAAESTLEAIREEADDAVCVLSVPTLDGVGRWYADFAAVPDDDVIAALRPFREQPRPRKFA